jgi:hypothetical protein
VFSPISTRISDDLTLEELEGLRGYFHVRPASVLTTTIRLSRIDAVRLERLRLVRQVVFEEFERRVGRAHVRRVLERCSAVLPSRVLREDLGDYIERINREVAAGETWRVWLTVVKALFWTILNALRARLV